MSEDPKNEQGTPREDFAKNVGDKASRKAKARRNAGKGVWSGLGMMGLIGWSVSVPTLIGVALGIWLDTKMEDSRSWTLALLVAGLCIGCLNAWHWISKENDAIHANVGADDE